jgi:hypothetical protein
MDNSLWTPSIILALNKQLTQINSCVNFGQTNSEQKVARTANSTFAIGGVSCSADSFVVAESLMLRINISGENPAHRKSAKRYAAL